MPQSPITDPLSWRAMTAPSLVDFEILANEVYSGLPKEFRTLRADLVIRIEDFATNEILERRASAENLAVSLRLGRLSVRRQQSEIVLGVLVVVLRRNDVPRPGFFLCKREISLVASLGALRPVQLGAGGTRCPPLLAGGKCPRRFGLARAHDGLWAILHGSFLITGDEICSRRSTKDQNLVECAQPLPWPMPLVGCPKNAHDLCG